MIEIKSQKLIKRIYKNAPTILWYFNIIINQITEKNLEKIFDRKTILTDPNSRIYIIRQEKARQVNEDKKKRVYWSSKNSFPKNNLSLGISNINPAILLTAKDEENNNNILNSNYINKNLQKLNLNAFKKNMRYELNNIECLYVKTESDDQD